MPALFVLSPSAAVLFFPNNELSPLKVLNWYWAAFTSSTKLSPEVVETLNLSRTKLFFSVKSPLTSWAFPCFTVTSLRPISPEVVVNLTSSVCTVLRLTSPLTTEIAKESRLKLLKLVSPLTEETFIALKWWPSGTVTIKLPLSLWLTIFTSTKPFLQNFPCWWSNFGSLIWRVSSLSSTLGFSSSGP